MAQEFEILQNPTSNPDAVSTGYQRQNTNMLAGRLGVDLTYVEADGADAVVKIAGPVDVNGVLYTCKADVTLTPGAEGAYFIRLKDAGSNYLEPELTQDPIAWDSAKGAFYDLSNRRCLNFIVRFDGVSTSEVRKIYPPSLQPDVPPKTWITADGSWIAPESKFYDIFMIAKGGNGGNASLINVGGTSKSAQAGGGGGAASGKKRIFIEAGTEWTAVFSASSLGLLVFSDGVNTLSVQNGANGNNADGNDENVYALGGNSGSSVSGLDLSIFSGEAGWGGGIESFVRSGRGGASFLSGSRQGVSSTLGTGVNGLAALGYGGGGSGASVFTISGNNKSGTGGSGRNGLIEITG